MASDYDYIDIETKSTYLKNKLDRLTYSIQNSASFQTQEAYINECNRILKSFYSTLSKPYFEYEEALKDDIPSPCANSTRGDNNIEYDYNLFWTQLLDNLTILFLEMENLESLSIANYNFAMVELSDLTARLKSVSSKLGDYILYSQSSLKDILLVRDSFNNLLRIESNSVNLTETECNINQEEGIITLPINVDDSKTIVVKSENVTIASSEGAALGNNHEEDSTHKHNGEIVKIVDNNPDTWFEYEKVVSKASENEPPLVLDLSLDLGSPKIINQVIVNPNNFGTKTVLSIDTIETSTDNRTFTSIKDDIPIVGYEVEDEENVFILAPSTSKYAGQGIYTFTPRKAQYLHIVISQSEPYIISTRNGERLRYAIGLRGINLKALAFEAKGELISKPFATNDEIKKVMLEAGQIPVKDSELTNIKYFISHNEGTSWNQIQPKHLSSASGIVSTVPEILNFNTVDANSVTTDTPVTNITLKIALERENDNFVEGSSSLAKTITSKSEVQGVPVASPFTITLEESPIEGSVVVIDPLFGSRGIKDSSYYIKYNQQQSEDTFSGLPFKNTFVPRQKFQLNGRWYTKNADAEDWLYVYVGGERWSQRTKPWKDYKISSEVADLEAYEATAPDSPTSAGDSSSFGGLAGNANYESSGGIVNPENAFDGGLETFTALTDITTVNNVYVDFTVNVTDVLKIEMYMPSPSSTGATVGRWTQLDQNDSPEDKVTLANFSGEAAGWKTLFDNISSGDEVTVTKIGWAINQGAVGSYEDRVSAFKFTLEGGGLIILDNVSQVLVLEEAYSDLVDANPQVLTVFNFDPISGELSFNPNSSYIPEQPPADAPISMHFGAERLFPGKASNNHKVKLVYPTSNSKESFTIIRYAEEVPVVMEAIVNGATKHNLANKNITTITNLTGYTSVSFINGAEEFSEASSPKYCIDLENGILYLSTPASATLTCSYKYIPKYELSETDWDWDGNDLLRQSIIIKDSGWVEIETTDTKLTLDNERYFGLEHLAIVNNDTLKFTIDDSETINPFFKEVTFVDGSIEFVAAASKARQYSVNYNHGEVYLSQDYSGDITPAYSYTNYEAQYRIAREVNSKHYDIDVPNKQIAIKDSEFFKYLETPNTTQSGKAAYYLVNYDYVAETREDIEELKDFFTPVVKDYMLKMLRSGKLKGNSEELGIF